MTRGNDPQIGAKKCNSSTRQVGDKGTGIVSRAHIFKVAMLTVALSLLLLTVYFVVFCLFFVVVVVVFVFYFLFCFCFFNRFVLYFV